MGWGRLAEGAGDEQVEAGGGSWTGRENRFLFLSEGRWRGRENGRVRAGQSQSLEKTKGPEAEREKRGAGSGRREIGRKTQ